MKSTELPSSEAQELERSKFAHWQQVVSAVRNRAAEGGGTRLEVIPSRSLLIRKPEFPASKVIAAISLDGQRVELEWSVRERIGGLVENASDCINVRIDQNGKLYFQHKSETLTVDELSQLIVSLAKR